MIHKTYSVGSDISAPWLDACLFKDRAYVQARFDQSSEGYAQFAAWLKEHGVSKAHICMEHTGCYEKAFAEFLIAQGYKVSIVDSGRIRGYKQSRGRKAKTDKIDAKDICDFCRTYKPEPWNPKPDPYQRLTELVRHRENLVEAITMWKNRRGAPGNREAFVREQQEGIIALFQLQLELAEKDIEVHVKAHPQMAQDVELIESIKGAKFISAVKFLAEAGPISGYSTPDSLALAAGLAPIPNTSGKRKGRSIMPIYGNKRLRQAVQMTATVAKQHNPALALFASRLTAKGKCPTLVTKAVQRKLLHIIWALLTHREPFDPAKAVRNFT